MASADQSVFVVNADDLGLAVSANAGIFRAFDEGCLSSASVAVTTSGFADALDGLRARPKLGVGLHFSLSAGRAVSGNDAVPLLTDESGRLKWRFFPLLRAMYGPQRAQLRAQIGIELEAQLQKLADHGIGVDHINGERHVHLIPGVFEAVLQAAKAHGIPNLRLIDDVSIRYLRLSDLPLTVANGGWVKFGILRALSRRAARLMRSQSAVASVRYASILFTGKMCLILDRIWAAPPPGVTELAVHPGLPTSRGIGTDVGNAALEHYLMSADREAETTICIELANRPTAAKVTTFADVYSSLARRTA